MDARTYEYQSDFARQYIAQGKAEGHSEGRSEGRAEGEALGRAALILRLLASRFGPIEAKTQSRIQRASIAELELIGERLLAARTLKEAVGDAA